MKTPRAALLPPLLLATIACVSTIPEVVPDLPDVRVVEPDSVSDCTILEIIEVTDGRMPDGAVSGYSSDRDRAVRRLKHRTAELNGNTVVVGDLYVAGVTMDGRGDEIMLEGTAYWCPETSGITDR